MSTLPSTQVPAAPGTRSSCWPKHVADTFIAMGWELWRGAEFGDRAVQLRRPQLPLPTTARGEQVQLRRAGGFAAAAAHPYLTGADSHLLARVPVYIISIGRTFRADELDATHTPITASIGLTWRWTAVCR